jgi:hypothetical protein
MHVGDPEVGRHRERVANGEAKVNSPSIGGAIGGPLV